MNKELDIKIYAALANKLSAAETYLGSIGYEFTYTKVEYQATCTEAFPFTPFDKVICRLLEGEDHLSFSEIGKILGLNVGNEGEAGAIKDHAEYEILMDALHSLSEFGMLEGGDITFSRCKLTSIGREYAKKKHRFKSTANKPFTLYFDFSTGDHKLAKQNFEYAGGSQLADNVQDLGFTEEALKQIAAVQAPYIYNEAKLFSFTGPQVVQRNDFSVGYTVALIYNKASGQVKCYCINNNFVVSHELSNWLSSDPHRVTDLVNKLQEEKSKSPDNEEKLPCMSADTFIEEYELLTSLEKYITPQEQTLYLNYSFTTEEVLSSVDSILHKLEEDSKCFIALPEPRGEVKEKWDERLGRAVRVHSESLSQCMFSSLQDLSGECVNLFVAERRCPNSLFIIKQKDAAIVFRETYVEEQIGGKKFKVKGYSREEGVDIEELEHQILTEFADYYIENEDYEYASLSEIITSYIQTISDDTLTVDELTTLSLLKEKIEVFKGMGQKQRILENAIHEANEFLDTKAGILREGVCSRLTEVKHLLSEEPSDGLFSKVDTCLQAIEPEISVLTGDKQLFEEYNTVLSSVCNAKAQFEEAKRCYTFIIDTNILLEDPEVMLRIDPKHVIIIAAKVLDELDKFKMDKTLAANVHKAVKIIKQDRNRNIKHNKGRPKLLPPDLNERSPDNLILSVAVQYQNNHGILITSDNLLAIKARNVLNLEVMNRHEFQLKFDTTLKN